MSESTRQVVPASTLSGDLSPIWPGALDPDALWIVRRLRTGGFPAFFVGGCVRDLLLGMIPKDFDIATSARPRQIKKLFRNSRIIGRRFRLVHVQFKEGKVIEVSTFRSDPKSDKGQDFAAVDSEASSAEEPEEDAEGADERDFLIVQDNVFGTEEEDALRRDFTINALFYDFEADQIIDYVGGVDDLRKRVLRTIGDAATRVREDPVRILRAVKFATRLQLTLDAELAAAMAEYHTDLVRSAPPRVFEEMLRMVSGPSPAKAVEILARLGILRILLPELGIRPHETDDHRLTQLLARLRVLGDLDRGRRSFSTALYFMVLLYDVTMEGLAEGEGATSLEKLDEILRPFSQRYRISRRDSARMRSAFLALRRIDPRLAGPRKKRRRQRAAIRDFVRRDYFPDALVLFRLICESQNRDFDALAMWEQRLSESTQSPTEVSAPEPAHRSTRRRRRRNRRGPAPPSISDEEAPLSE